MEAMETVRVAAKRRGISESFIGVAMGKSRQYISSTISRGSCPRADTLANMLDICNYRLCVLPDELVPPEAMVIDESNPKNDLSARLEALREKRAKLKGEQDRLVREIASLDEQLELYE